MATTQQTENASDDGRRIDSDRYERAIAGDMTIEETAPRLFRVTHDGCEYEIDVEGGACTCEDHQYRGDRLYCKHVVFACVHARYAGTRITRLMARVARFGREYGCPREVRGCDGPLGPAYPCAGCVAATATGDWSVWTALTATGRDPWELRNAGECVATDGGTQEASR